MKESPKKATFGTSAEELFNNLSMNDSTENKALLSRGPPQRSGTLPLQGHRPTRSGEEDRLLRSGPPRGPPRPRALPGQKIPIGSPDRSENRRPRRNSESSMIDKGSLDPDEERKRRERRKEREARARDGKDGKDGKSRSGRVRKPHGLDLIDKLDVTGIYGPGLFHHDGPFDACNPHRNRKKDHRAPMQAFPANSANNALGGSGPINKNIDLEKFHGRGAEGFTDFARSGADSNLDAFGKKRPSLEQRSISFNPKDRVEPIHGEETIGLGTSTFLEGAPASRTAIQRRESENEAAALQNGGLGRKKSIAQRIRGISQPRRGFGEGGPRITSPESRYEGRPGGVNGVTTPGSPPPALPTKNPQSAGGYAKMNEQNPFFDDYDEAYEKKGATIKVAEPEPKDVTPMPTRAPPDSTMRGNGSEGRMTTDSTDGLENGKSTNGFLSRVKSLKGGKRTRPERRPS